MTGKPPVDKYSPHLGNTWRQFITIKRYNQHKALLPTERRQACVYFQASLVETPMAAARRQSALV